MSRALVFGSEGQDGRCLSELLASYGEAYRVTGISRNSGIDLLDENAVASLIRSEMPDEVYFLAAYHHSSEQKIESELDLWNQSFKVHVHTPNVILEALRKHRPQARFFYASSSLVFGASTGMLSEESPLAPDSPYGITKSAGMSLCQYYRNKFGIFASCGILFNHESEFRKPQFLSKKIALAVKAIQRGSKEKLKLGNLNAEVDWGYARDYVDAMVRILKHDHPENFIVSTGKLHSVRDFVSRSFALAGLNREEWVDEDSAVLQRQIPSRRGDSSKLRRMTNWTPRTDFDTMIEILLKAEGVSIV